MTTTATKKTLIFKHLQQSRFFWTGLGVSCALSCGFLLWLGIKWRETNAELPNNVTDVVSYSRPNTLTIKAEDETILDQYLQSLSSTG